MIGDAPTCEVQAVELCRQDIQREIGPLSVMQQIALERALERLTADVRRIAMCDWDPSHGF